MNDFSIIKESEGDLQNIINEVLQKKSISHIRDRAERAVSALGLISDRATLFKAVEEVLSTLLITTEVGSVPRLIQLSLNVLQKLAGSKAISGDSFLHMVTVLCKAASSVSSGLSSLNPISSEVELAQVRCLQTLHLLQVESFSLYFLNDVALSQMVSMCTNLMNHPFASPVVVQTASASVRQLQLFLTETCGRLLETSAVTLVTSAELPCILNAQGEVVGIASLADSVPNTARPIFLFIHDLITMSFPADTVHVACSLFGGTRLKRELALEMLGDLFAANDFWVKSEHFLFLISQYLVPVLLRCVNRCEVPVLRLVVRLSRFSAFKVQSDIGSVLAVFSRILSSGDTEVGVRVLVTEALVVAVARNPIVLRSDRGTRVVDPRSPLGGDSPLSSEESFVETLVSTVCMYIHHPDRISRESVLALATLNIRMAIEAQSAAQFTLLWSNTASMPELCESHAIALSVDFILSFIDTVRREKCHSDGSRENSSVVTHSAITSTWPSVLSCLSLQVGTSGDLICQLPGILTAFESLLFCCRDVPEAVKAILSSVVKLTTNSEGVARVVLVKFLANLVHRISHEDFASEIPVWRMALRALEMQTGQLPVEEENFLVVRSSLDALFSAASSPGAVELLVQALLPALTPWTCHRLGQLLGSSNDAAGLWQRHVAVAISAFAAGLAQEVEQRDRMERRHSVSPNSPVVSAVIELAVLVVEKHPETCGEVCLKSLVGLARFAPTKVVAAVTDCVRNVGHLMIGWEALTDLVGCVCDTPGTFKLVELVLDDFIERIEISKFLNFLTLLFPISTMNVCFRATSLALKCAEKGRDEQALETFFASAALDPRAEVRNCAVKTVGVSPLSGKIILKIIRPIFDHQPEDGCASPAPDEESGILVHHSRDSEEKRWTETKLLALKAIRVDGVSGLIDDLSIVLFKAWEVQELIPVGAKLVVEFFKIREFADDPFLVEFLQAEIQMLKNNNSTTSPLPFSTSVLLPLLLSAAPLQRGPQIDSLLSSLLSAVIGWSSLYYAGAIPYQQTAGYVHETEPYHPTATLCVTDDRILYSPTPEAVRLDPFLSSLLRFDLFDSNALVPMLLNPNVLFRDSFTVAMAVGYLQSGLLQAEALIRITDTRNGSVAIASSGIWKFAVQGLILGKHFDRLAEVVVGARFEDRVIDRIDFASILLCDRTPEFAKWTEEKLESLGPQFPLLHTFLLLAVLVSAVKLEVATPSVVHAFNFAKLSDGLDECQLFEALWTHAPRTSLPPPILCAALDQVLFRGPSLGVLAVVRALKRGDNLKAVNGILRTCWGFVCFQIANGSAEVRSELADLLARQTLCPNS